MKVHTKAEIAISSLLQAKRMFLAGDYISATILAGAGQQILRDLCKSRAVMPTIARLSGSSGYSVKSIHNLVTDSYNKMKHAEKDPEEMVEVSEDEARVLMTLAATDLMLLKEIKSKEISDFVDFVRNIKAAVAGTS